MAFINFTNRIELKCNSEPISVSDFVIYASSLNNKIFVFCNNLEKVKSEIKKRFNNISFEKIEIYLEAYRDAFRKEIKLGNLSNPNFDEINFFQKKVNLNPKIQRDLGEIDSSSVRCRMIFSSEMRNIASSESMGFRPIIFSKQEEIVSVEKIRKKSLIGLLEEEMDKLFYSDFHGEGKHQGAPTIYVNKKLGIKNDLSADKRISTIIFSSSFEDLLRKSLINPDNKFKEQLIEYAQNHNENIIGKELSEKIGDMHIDEFFTDQDISEFISNAVEGYIRDFEFVNKYIYDQQKFNNSEDDFDENSFLGEDDEA